MIDTCESLADHVRANLPPANGITCLKAHEAHGFVSFRWYERDFVVKKSLEVFEVKGQNLFVTGASILLQSVLAKADFDTKIVEAVVSSIRQVEDLMGEEDQRDSGFQLLSTVRDTLKKLSRQPVESPRPGALKVNPLITSISSPKSAEPAAVAGF